MKRLSWLIVGIAIIATVVMATYAVILVTQKTPTLPIKTPSSSTGLVSLCSDLSGPYSNVPSNTVAASLETLQYTGSYQTVSVYLACGAGIPPSNAAINVTASGYYIPSFSIPSAVGWLIYPTTLYIYCWPSTATNPCYGTSGFSAELYSGTAVQLSQGTYGYGFGLQISPYTSSSSTSIPSFTITWGSA